MVIRTLDRKVLRDLKLMKGQLLTLSLVVGIGIALFFASVSSYSSLERATENFYRSHQFADIFASVKRAPLQLLKEIEEIPDVLQTEARISFTGLMTISQHQEPIAASVLSYPQKTRSSLNQVFLFEGSAPQGENEIVLHQSFTKTNGLKLGDRIQILLSGQIRHFEIVGIGTSPEFVYALNPAAPLPDSRHFAVGWIDYSSFEKILGLQDSFNDLVIRAREGASLKEVQRRLDEKLLPFGTTGSLRRDHQLSARLIQDELQEQKALAIFMPLFFLVVSAFILNIIVSRYISLQRAQIGNLKVLGYSDLELGAHYLKFVLLIVLLATLPGLALGYALGYLEIGLYKEFFSFPQIPFQPQASAIVLSFGLALICGLVSGFFSIRRAFLLSPAEALRPPSPEIFHHQRPWALLFPHSQRLKMSLRNFLHKPLRTGLVAIGLAMALALMVMALGWNDVIHYMIDGQFTRVQRENISMSFLRLRPLSVLQELNQIPGVLKAEGVRELPVSLHYRQFNKIMVLQGINPQNQLRQITDSHFDPLPIPTTGLALSRRLQEQWQLKLGDVITFERRDGVPGRYSLPVSAFIDDLLGEGAYLAESELHSLLREEPSLTSAHLSVDPAQLMDVYKQLSQMPQIRSVSLKEFFLKGFNESMGGMIQSFVLILIFFASLMVLGIVFNSVQISFAERSWEFASLRVLGFYPEEVFSILFVEFFLILLLALVPGLVFGHSLTSLSLRLIQSESFHFSLQIYPSSYGLSILAIVASFALSLMLTYFMVKKLKLVEALKARE